MNDVRQAVCICCLRKCPPPKSSVLSFEHGSRQGKDARGEYSLEKFCTFVKERIMYAQGTGLRTCVDADDVVCMVDSDDGRETETCDNGRSALLSIMKAT